MCSSMKSIKCLMFRNSHCCWERVAMKEPQWSRTQPGRPRWRSLRSEPSVDLLVTDALLTERALEPNQVVRVDATVVNRGGRAATSRSFATCFRTMASGIRTTPI